MFVLIKRHRSGVVRCMRPQELVWWSTGTGWHISGWVSKVMRRMRRMKKKEWRWRSAIYREVKLTLTTSREGQEVAAIVPTSGLDPSSCMVR
jgi:hypothetical protein